MKMKRLIYPILILILVTLACGPFPAAVAPTQVLVKPSPTAVKQQPTKVVIQPTATEVPQLPTPTLEPVVIPPTDTPAPSLTDYYTEEFENGIVDWLQFVVAGNPNLTYYADINNHLKFEVPSNETYAYSENIKYTYSDVYVQTNFSTTETSSDNGISVFCRKSDKGWYELRVSTMGGQAGFIQVYRYDPKLKDAGSNPYIDLLTPVYKQNALPVQEIVPGFNINTIAIQCSNNNLSFFANGKPMMNTRLKKPIALSDDFLTEGTTGVGVQSGYHNKAPVVIEFDWVSASAPK
jgi:hypothetical protein